jgi:hypothetical protein
MHTIQIFDDMMIVLDEDGNGRDCHILRTQLAAQRQLRKWLREYKFDLNEAMNELAEYFEVKQNTINSTNSKFTEIAKTVLNILTLSSQGTDRLDFHDISVVQIKSALYAAYEAGRASRK